MPMSNTHGAVPSQMTSQYPSSLNSDLLPNPVGRNMADHSSLNLESSDRRPITTHTENLSHNLIPLQASKSQLGQPNWSLPTYLDSPAPGSPHAGHSIPRPSPHTPDTCIPLAHVQHFSEHSHGHDVYHQLHDQSSGQPQHHHSEYLASGPHETQQFPSKHQQIHHEMQQQQQQQPSGQSFQAHSADKSGYYGPGHQFPETQHLKQIPGQMEYHLSNSQTAPNMPNVYDSARNDAPQSCQYNVTQPGAPVSMGDINVGPKDNLGFVGVDRNDSSEYLQHAEQESVQARMGNIEQPMMPDSTTKTRGRKKKSKEKVLEKNMKDDKCLEEANALVQEANELLNSISKRAALLAQPTEQKERVTIAVEDDDELGQFASPEGQSKPKVKVEPVCKDGSEFQTSFLSFLKGKKPETLTSVSNSIIDDKPSLPKYCPDMPRSLCLKREKQGESDSESMMDIDCDNIEKIEAEKCVKSVTSDSEVEKNELKKEVVNVSSTTLDDPEPPVIVSDVRKKEAYTARRGRKKTVGRYMRPAQGKKSVDNVEKELKISLKSSSTTEAINTDTNEEPVVRRNTPRRASKVKAQEKLMGKKKEKEVEEVEVQKPKSK